MRILVLGADGYLGWPTSLTFLEKGHEVIMVDSFYKRKILKKLKIASLIKNPRFDLKINKFKKKSWKYKIEIGDLTNTDFVDKIIKKYKPKTIIHLGQQPSAPYSMINSRTSIDTHNNNLNGMINLLFAMKKYSKNSHLIKLGTMGEYGTPNIFIEEGFIKIKHKGRSENILFPKKPGSFYHLTKVHDSNNIAFASRIWGIKCTELNQGVVWGVSNRKFSNYENNHFYYDHVFGTIINRFAVQACAGVPLTVYGKGTQIRGIINLEDSISCIYKSFLNPPNKKNKFLIYNQFGQIINLKSIAKIFLEAGKELNLKVKINYLKNPRIEKDKHYYKTTNNKLRKLGINFKKFNVQDAINLIKVVQKNKKKIDKRKIFPKVYW